MSTLNNAFPQGRSQAPAIARHNVTFAQILYEYIQPSTSLAAKLAKTHERRWCIEATKTFLNSCMEDFPSPGDCTWDAVYEKAKVVVADIFAGKITRNATV